MTTRRACQLIVATTFALSVAIAAATQAAESADEVTRRCLELLRSGDVEAARGCFAPDGLPEDGMELLERAHQALQLGDAVELELVNRGSAHTAQGGRIDTLVYHARGGERALLIVAQARETDSGPALISLRWEAAPLDLSERFPFGFSGVPPLYYAVLGLAVAVPIFILYSAFVCFLRKPPRRWLWILFILVGIGRLSVVWVPGPLNLGYVGLTPVWVQLLGAGIAKTPSYDPWVVSVSFPLGAVLFLWRQRTQRGQAEYVLAARRAAAADEPRRFPSDSG